MRKRAEVDAAKELESSEGFVESRAYGVDGYRRSFVMSLLVPPHSVTEGRPYR